MPNITIREGDVGTTFLLTIVDSDGTTPIDVSGATSLKIIFKQPASGSAVIKDAVLNDDGTDGKIKYVTIDGDISTQGTWKIQAYAEISAGQFYSEILNVNVGKILAEIT